MKRSFAALVFLSVALPGAALAELPRKPTPVEEFQVFWTNFRAAVLADRTDQVAEHTAFPFKTRGPVDSDPIVTHTKESFLKNFAKWINMDVGLSKEPESMRQYIERKTTVTVKDVSANGVGARVANFVFNKARGRWLFTMAYVEE